MKENLAGLLDASPELREEALGGRRRPAMAACDLKTELSPDKFGSYELSCDIQRIDWRRVHGWLASSYWTPGISLERVKRGGENSALVLGVYLQSAQVGYLRVISDKTRFAYLCDVWVDAEHRGRGLARRMVQFALEHPDFATVNWLLATLDAHAVYAKLGFTPLTNPERWMSRGTFCVGAKSG